MRKQALRQRQYFLLLILLLFPVTSVIQTSIGLDFSQNLNLSIFVYVLLISLLTFFIYRSDKKKAEKKSWRTPEARLHFLELIGGWPGAFLAQRVYRHKIAKRRYQIIFWLIIICYQALALDYLFRGPFSTWLFGVI